MASGGARARSGPPPDPDALRRERLNDPGWIVLPVTGRAGDPPAWPLTEASERELHWWSKLWAKPQAVQWERLDLVHEVALYVRRLSEVELPGATSAAANHLIRLSESLGLTTAGLRMNRWQIAGEQTVATPTVAAEKKPPARRASARSRLRVVPADGGA